MCYCLLVFGIILKNITMDDEPDEWRALASEQPVDRMHRATRYGLTINKSLVFNIFFHLYITFNIICLLKLLIHSFML